MNWFKRSQFAMINSFDMKCSLGHCILFSMGSSPLIFWILGKSANTIATSAVKPALSPLCNSPSRWQTSTLQAHMMIPGPTCGTSTRICLLNCTCTSETLCTGWQRARVFCFVLEQVLITLAAWIISTLAFLYEAFLHNTVLIVQEFITRWSCTLNYHFSHELCQNAENRD